MGLFGARRKTAAKIIEMIGREYCDHLPPAVSLAKRNGQQYSARHRLYTEWRRPPGCARCHSGRDEENSYSLPGTKFLGSSLPFYAVRDPAHLHEVFDMDTLYAGAAIKPLDRNGWMSKLQQPAQSRDRHRTSERGLQSPAAGTTRPAKYSRRSPTPAASLLQSRQTADAPSHRTRLLSRSPESPLRRAPESA